MSKYRIVPDTATDEMLSAAQKAWLDDPMRRTSTMYSAMLAAAPAPVASAEDVERVAQVIHDAEKASFIRNGGAWIGSTPDGRHYEQARAALRAMGYEVA